MRNKMLCLFATLVVLSSTNAQGNPFDMNGVFQNMGGSMQNMFQNMQNNFKQLVPWYHGANVCVDEQFHPDPMNQQMHPGEFGPNAQAESCQGDNFQYICMASVNANGGALQRVRRYECCQGFVRAMEGPGCIHNNG